MNVLFVNNAKKRAGGEEFLEELLPALARKGVKIGIVCRPGAPLADMFRGTDIKVYPLEKSSVKGLISIFKVAGIIRSSGYEIISIQRGHDIIQSWLAALLSGRRPVLLYTVHILNFLKSRFLLRRMRKIITISRYLFGKIVSYEPAFSQKTHIIHHGIDLRLFATRNTGKKGMLRRRFNIPPDARIIGTVGVLWKNQIEFLDALVEIRREFPKARYVVAAGGSSIEHTQKFMDRVAELGLSDAVLVLEKMPRCDMPSFYADIDIAVSTFCNEGFGIWVLEALAMGKPMVALNAGGICDALEGCPAGSLVNGAEKMAAEIIRILRDETLYARMAKAGSRWVKEKFTRERMVEDYLRLFASLSGEHGVKSTGERLRAEGNSMPRALCPMRILQIISKNDRYGAQRVFLDQVNILHKMGNAVFVVTRGTEGYVTDSVRAMDIPCYGIPMKGLRDIFFLRNLVKEYKIDIIHTSLDRADYFGVILSWFTRRPVISTMHVRRYHTALRFATTVIVSAHVQERKLKAKGIKPQKIHLIRPGIDVERFKYPDAKKQLFWERTLNTKKYSIIFCHISSLHAPKAHIVSLELTAECKKTGEKPLLIIVGGPLKEEYQKTLLIKIDELDLKDNVRFTDWTRDVPELLSLSHFTVLPSKNEALGMVLLEGMAAGTPIIARQGEGGAELVQEYGAGFLYKPDEGIAPLARKVISLRRDSAQYRALSERCRKIASDEFSLTKFGERLAEIYSLALRKQ